MFFHFGDGLFKLFQREPPKILCVASFQKLEVIFLIRVYRLYWGFLADPDNDILRIQHSRRQVLQGIGNCRALLITVDVCGGWGYLLKDDPTSFKQDLAAVREPFKLESPDQ